MWIFFHKDCENSTNWCNKKIIFHILIKKESGRSDEKKRKKMQKDPTTSKSIFWNSKICLVFIKATSNFIQFINNSLHNSTKTKETHLFVQLCILYWIIIFFLINAWTYGGDEKKYLEEFFPVHYWFSANPTRLIIW